MNFQPKVPTYRARIVTLAIFFAACGAIVLLSGRDPCHRGCRNSVVSCSLAGVPGETEARGLRLHRSEQAMSLLSTVAEKGIDAAQRAQAVRTPAGSARVSERLFKRSIRISRNALVIPSACPCAVVALSEAGAELT